MLFRSGFHQKTGENGAFCEADGVEIQEGECYAPYVSSLVLYLSLDSSFDQPSHLTSGPEGNIPAANFRREEESTITHVHTTRSHDEGYNRRGQCLRTRDGHHWRQGCVWKIRSDHKQSGK